jgi:hypothetical protein
LDQLRPIATCAAVIDHLHIRKAAYFLGTKRRLNNRAIDGLIGDLHQQARSPSQKLFRYDLRPR